jgi:hypothetical protein
MMTSIDSIVLLVAMKMSGSASYSNDPGYLPY